MYSVLFLGLLACASALVATPLVRTLALRFGLVDRPDCTRKLHQNPVPRVGGLAIVLAYLAAFALLIISPLKGGNLVESALPFALRLLPSAGLIFCVGLIDDLVGLRPWQKLLGQVAAALLAVSAGIHITGFFAVSLAPWLSSVLTVVWLVGCANAFNLIDGMDGLATGVGLFATTTIAAAAVLAGNVPLALATVPLAGALLGFLRYNFNPASIFLGDCGSLTIGFALGAFGILWSQKATTMLGMTAPLMALALPLLDTALAIARRFLRGQPIFGADRGHIHHKLLSRGLTVRRAVFLIYGFCFLSAALSLLLQAFSRHLGPAIILVFCAAMLLGVHFLRYTEFRVARRMFLGGAFRSHIDAQVTLEHLIQSIQSARSVNEAWDALRTSYTAFGFTDLDASLAGHHFSHTNDNSDGDVWCLTVPLAGNDSVTFARGCRNNHRLEIPGRMAERLRDALIPKLSEFRSAPRPVPVRAEARAASLTAITAAAPRTSGD